MDHPGKRIGVVVAHIAIALAGGCYDPALRDCTVRCASSSDCAGSQICLADGLCANLGIARCDDGQPVAVDALAVAADTAVVSTPDARDLCPLGCSNGTCVDGVCVIDCSATDTCSNDVICPANLPCHVICGDSSCGHKVNCSMALACTVECIGDGACADEIICSTHECDVICSGTGACKRRTKCSTACSCDVTCSGTSSCMEASECPHATCRVGNGCSSLPVGCDSCP